MEFVFSVLEKGKAVKSKTDHFRGLIPEVQKMILLPSWVSA